MTTKDEDIAELLHEYDEALRNEDFEAVAVLATKIQAAKEAEPLEPAPENAWADAEESLAKALLPVDLALHDGKYRTFYLHCGARIFGRVTDANLFTFTVESTDPDPGRRVWIVVRSAVEAIELDLSESEGTPTL